MATVPKATLKSLKSWGFTDIEYETYTENQTIYINKVWCKVCRHKSVKYKRIGLGITRVKSVFHIGHHLATAREEAESLFERWEELEARREANDQ